MTYISQHNPSHDWRVGQGENEEGEEIAFIEVAVRCGCKRPCCSDPIVEWRRHDSAPTFTGDEAAVEASDWIENLAERWEEQYDEYLEENRHSIVQMERYEMWQREY